MEDDSRIQQGQSSSEWILDNAKNDNEILTGLRSLLDSGEIIGVFNKALKNQLVCEFVKQSILFKKGEASEISWILLLINFGVFSDLPYLIGAEKIQSTSVTPAVIKTLRKATILEHCLTHRIVDLNNLQKLLTLTNQEPVTIDLIKELLIDCVFDDILKGKIDEEHEQFYVSWVRPCNICLYYFHIVKSVFNICLHGK